MDTIELSDPYSGLPVQVRVSFRHLWRQYRAWGYGRFWALLWVLVQLHEYGRKP